MLTLRSGSLFSGYGGLDMGVTAALARFGVRLEPAWFCEFDAAPSKILAHHWPHVPNFGDVTKVDFARVEQVAVMTGGFPCQDVSVAGRQAGLKDGTRSGLWAEFRRAISEQRPRLVVIENVRGLLSADGEPWHPDMVAADAEVSRWDRVIDLIKHRMERWAGDREYTDRKRGELVRATRHRKRAVAGREREHRLVQRAIATVLRDLADIGFDAEWGGLEASTVGAPHARFRVFIIAWPRDGGGRLLRTPVADEDGGGPLHPDVAKERGQTLRLTGQILAMTGDLLPTPVAHPSGNTPEDHLRKKPRRTRVTDLAIMAENDLIRTGGRVAPVADSDDK